MAGARYLAASLVVSLLVGTAAWLLAAAVTRASLADPSAMTVGLAVFVPTYLVMVLVGYRPSLRVKGREEAEGLVEEIERIALSATERLAEELRGIREAIVAERKWEEELAEALSGLAEREPEKVASALKGLSEALKERDPVKIKESIAGLRKVLEESEES